MAAIQLNFTLRTSSNAKTVHLLGSWDGYQGQLPLSKDSAKKGGWKGTFRFQGGTTLTPGARYWYYYIIDGYHVSHDPAKESTVEPTTGRKLNILDIPKSSSTTKSSRDSHASAASSDRRSKRSSRQHSIEIPKGRALSPSKIQSPRAIKPGQVQKIVNAAEQYEQATLEQLNSRFSQATLSDSEDDSDDDSDSDGTEFSDSDSVPSLTSRSSNSSSPSSLSSHSSCCTCERYGITRAGGRVKLDCGGSRCGYSDGGSSCSSSDEEEVYRVRTTRRQGMVVK